MVDCTSQGLVFRFGNRDKWEVPKRSIWSQKKKTPKKQDLPERLRSSMNAWMDFLSDYFYLWFIFVVDVWHMSKFNHYVFLTHPVNYFLIWRLSLCEFIFCEQNKPHWWLSNIKAKYIQVLKLKQVNLTFCVLTFTLLFCLGKKTKEPLSNRNRFHYHCSHKCLCGVFTKVKGWH